MLLQSTKFTTRKGNFLNKPLHAFWMRERLLGSASGLLAIIGGTANYLFYDATEKTTSQLSGVVDMHQYIHHLLLPFGAAMAVGAANRRAGKILAGGAIVANAGWEYLQSRAAIPGGYQLEDLVAGTAGAAVAYLAINRFYPK